MKIQTIQEDNKEQIIDDFSTEIIKTNDIYINIQEVKKQEIKQEKNMSAKIIGNKDRSASMFFIGSGQAGSRISAVFKSLGYSAVAVNTATQDLKHIKLLDSEKLLLEGGFGGAAKDLQIGSSLAEANRDAIAQLIHDNMQDANINVFCTSLGGGSGAGSVETIIDILKEIGKPIIVITALPMETEDAQTKANALETLAKLSNMSKNNEIANLICIDNAKIEAIYHDVSQMKFYDIANNAIASVLDAFNTYSAMPSPLKGLDSVEFLKIIIDSGGLTTFGTMELSNYEDDTAIAAAVINNLSSNLLSEGFDLTQSKYVGFMICANENVWNKIPASSVNYALSMIADQCGNPNAIFKGLYCDELITEDVVKVYSIFSGLGLPNSRVEQLTKETKELQEKVKVKDNQRSLTLNLNTGKNDTISAAQKVKDKILAKSSTFGKLMGGVSDRRK